MDVMFRSSRVAVCSWPGSGEGPVLYLGLTAVSLGLISIITITTTGEVVVRSCYVVPVYAAAGRTQSGGLWCDRAQILTTYL